MPSATSRRSAGAPHKRLRARTTIVALVALVLALPGGSAGLATAAVPALSTADYLELPEIFQVSVVSGSMAILTRWAAERGDAAADDCYRRWTSAEDVAALVVSHARRTPGAVEAPFADTLIAALMARCATG
jgi:hypothetical protein